MDTHDSMNYCTFIWASFTCIHVKTSNVCKKNIIHNLEQHTPPEYNFLFLILRLQTLRSQSPNIDRAETNNDNEE